jgi:UDP-N-acetylmuramyl pentapeptide synthase
MALDVSYDRTRLAKDDTGEWAFVAPLKTRAGRWSVDGLVGTLESLRMDEVALALSGRHNVVNALAAAGAGVALGFSLAEIATGLAAARPAKGRCVWRMAGEVRLLDDTYNANPESVRAALDTVAAHRGGARRLVVVLGDMLELGPAAEDAHREIGRYAVSPAGADVVVGMGRHARTLVEAARAAGVSEAQHTETFEDTVAFLLKELVPGDLVLVKGSRGMRMERVVAALVARLARAGQE